MLKVLFFISTLVTNSLSYANMLDGIPIEMSCKTNQANDSFVEVYNFFDMGFIFAFKNNDEVVSLGGVEKSQENFILKNHLYNAALSLTDNGVYSFSVYEVGGFTVVSPTLVECSKPYPLRDFGTF